MQDHFYRLRSNYGILFLTKFQPLDQGPALVGRLIAFWVLLRQQLPNDIFVFAVEAQLCHVVQKTNKQTNKQTNKKQNKNIFVSVVFLMFEAKRNRPTDTIVFVHVRTNIPFYFNKNKVA